MKRKYFIVERFSEGNWLPCFICEEFSSIKEFICSLETVSCSGIRWYFVSDFSCLSDKDKSFLKDVIFYM